jgi:outer membrane protein TolC
MIERREFWWMLVSLVAALLVMAESSRAITLEDYLKLVARQHGSLRALEASSAAAEDRKITQQLDLSPVLTMSGGYLDDKKLQASAPSYIVNHSEVRTYSLGLGKKFTTGTAVQLTGTAQQVNSDYIYNSAGGASQVGIGSLGISLSQSLWKDGFGGNTRLRLERQRLFAEIEKQGYDLQAQQLLIEAEAAFWDLVFQANEVELRTSSLERSKRINTWVRQRFGNGIGDRADVLNAEGLMATRELQLIASQDDLKAAQKRVADILELGAGEPLPDLKGDLNAIRELRSYIGGVRDEGSDGKDTRIVRLDAYLSVLESKAKALSAEEVIGGMKPDLSLQGSYQTNALATDETAMAAFNKAGKTDRPTAYVGLQLTWLLDGEVKNANRNAAKMDALAALLKQERKLLESESSWSEMQRRHGELSKKIEIATRISRVQTEKAAAERDKLSKGRSITSQVILAEQDAAEAELTLAKLKAEQRKMEAQGRLFVKVGAK